MIFFSTTDRTRRESRWMFVIALFEFFHADPRVITRAERLCGRASLAIGGIRRFDPA